MIEVHSVDEGGHCTCDYFKQKQAKKTGKPFTPCADNSIGKHPRGNDWQKSQTTDPDQITARWEDFKHFRANVGIVYGGKSGKIVLDFDGDDGRATRKQWEEEGLLPPL